MLKKSILFQKGVKKMKGSNYAIFSVIAVVAAALIVALALVGTQPQAGQERQIVVNIPDYLQKPEGSGFSGSSGTISFAESDSGKRLLSVSGTIVKTAAPDKASVILSVSTLDKSASKSQSDNAELANKVMAALASAGIAEDDVKTVSYNLSEEFQWNDSLRKSESVGFRTNNSIQVTVRDLSKVGSVIDAAVQAGANSVSSVSFELSEQKMSELKTAALSDAAQNARQKANSIAAGLGVSVGQVYSASESFEYYVPVYKSYPMESAGVSAAPTPITPGDIEFSATVSVQFEIA